MPITAILQGIASALTFWKNNKKEIEEVKEIFKDEFKIPPSIYDDESLILLTMAVYDSHLNLAITIDEAFKIARRSYLHEKESQIARFFAVRQQEKEQKKRKLEEDDGN